MVLSVYLFIIILVWIIVVFCRWKQSYPGAVRYLRQRVFGYCEGRTTPLPMHYLLANGGGPQQHASSTAPLVSVEVNHGGASCTNDNDRCTLMEEFDDALLRGSKMGLSTWLFNRYPGVDAAIVPDIQMPGCVFLTARGTRTCGPVATLMESTAPSAKEGQAMVLEAMKQLNAFEAVMKEHAKGKSPESVPETPVTEVHRHPQRALAAHELGGATHMHQMGAKQRCPVAKEMDGSVPPLDNDKVYACFERALKSVRPALYLPGPCTVKASDVHGKRIDAYNLLLHVIIISEERNSQLHLPDGAMTCNEEELAARNAVGWDVLSICARQCKVEKDGSFSLYHLASNVLQLQKSFLVAVMSTLLHRAKTPEFKALAWLGAGNDTGGLFESVCCNNPEGGRHPAHTAMNTSDAFAFVPALGEFAEKSKDQTLPCDSTMRILYVVSSFVLEIAARRGERRKYDIRCEQYHSSDILVKLGWYGGVFRDLIENVRPHNARRGGVITMGQFELLATRSSEWPEFVTYTCAVHKRIVVSIGSYASLRGISPDVDPLGISMLRGDRDCVGGMMAMNKLDIDETPKMDVANIPGKTTALYIDGGIILWRVFIRSKGDTCTGSLRKLMTYYKKNPITVSNPSVVSTVEQFLKTLRVWNAEHHAADAGCILNFLATLIVVRRAKVSMASLQQKQALISRLVEQSKADSILRHVIN